MEEEKPLSVAISALMKKNKILLIKRVRGNYTGFWGLPGGKIEGKEHASEAAVREIKEETGMSAEFKKHMGIVSEHLVEDDEITGHFLLHICKLQPNSGNAKERSEGKVKWFELSDLEEHKDDIIPSDYLMIHEIIDNPEVNYCDCILEAQDEGYGLKKWRKR